MKEVITKSAKFSLDKCLRSPLFLATGSSWRRILHQDGTPAAMPVVYRDGQPSIDGDIHLLQVMAAAPEMHSAIEDILEVIDLPDLNPAIKSRVINLQLALAKANNLNGDNTMFILQSKIELCKNELKVIAKTLITSPFAAIYSKKYTERYGELNQDIIDRTVTNLCDDISYDKNGKITIVDGNYLERAILRYTVKTSKYGETLNRPSL
ncbi:hypothetical protein OTK49_02520 [Vibrio coralliirubri]|uniref:hypothetical protein n=1 Tax=Vibrio coralliirubri TaxID=1516159 RepID=UPI0022833AE0|nr:hypothetical protein [Vibrio coralliirubri]MCY9861391.1 hypothetical protein [Vibrio coralliirubri]